MTAIRRRRPCPPPAFFLVVRALGLGRAPADAQGGHPRTRIAPCRRELVGTVHAAPIWDGVAQGQAPRRIGPETEPHRRRRSGRSCTLGGAAATHYILAGMPLDDVATILGWELKRVKELARRYVTGEAIGLGMIARLQETWNRPPTVKPSVKPIPRAGGRKRSNRYGRMAGELGLEPRMTVPKTVVLPLHHSPAGSAQPGG